MLRQGLGISRSQHVGELYWLVLVLLTNVAVSVLLGFALLYTAYRCARTLTGSVCVIRGNCATAVSPQDQQA